LEFGIADWGFWIAELTNCRKFTTEAHGVTRKRKNIEKTFFSSPPQAVKTPLCNSVKNPWLKKIRNSFDFTGSKT